MLTYFAVQAAEWLEEQPLIRLALFGAPVSHSASPFIHARFGEQAGLALDYQAIETPLGQTQRGPGCNSWRPAARAAI